MRTRVPPSFPVIAVLAAALAAAPWPEGEITGDERQLTARPRRVGTVRLDADAGHGPDDAADPALAVAPVDRLAALTAPAAPAPPLVALPPAIPHVGSPAAKRLAVARHATSPMRRRPARRPRTRAPPAIA